MFLDYCILLTAISSAVYADKILTNCDSSAKSDPEITSRADLVNGSPDVRIVGGSNASITDYPWQLSLRISNKHYCGAVLISDIWALTAAHCIVDVALEHLSVVGGTSNVMSGGVLRSVRKIVCHPNFHIPDLDNDISLIQLNSSFTFSDAISPVTLPAQGESIAVGTESHVTGWGLDSSGKASIVLQQLTAPIVAQTTCNNRYSGKITPQMICAGYLSGGKDACKGDSGGPLVTGDGKLVGIVSWGKGCGKPDYPGVYTRVASFRTWIEKNSKV